MFPHLAFFQAGYPNPDGTTTAVHGLALGLARLGWRVTILGSGQREAASRLPEHSNLHTFVFDRARLRGFAVDPSLISKLRQNSEGFDLLVINTMFNPPNIAVARAALSGGIPYVVSPHDPYHPELLKKSRLRKLIYSALFEKALLRNAAAIQVLAPEHADWLKPYKVRNVVVVPNGFDDDGGNLLNGSDRSPSTSLRGDPALLCLGRIDVHHKGLDLLVAGFASARHKGVLPPSAKLLLVGRGSSAEWDSLRTLAERHRVVDEVCLLGEASESVRKAMLQECDALVLASRYDGFGLVALEAMLAGKPVLVSGKAGIARWVEKAQAGLVFEPAVEPIADCLARFVECRADWTTWGSNGSNYVRRHLTWDQVAEHADDCYRQLLGMLQDTPSTHRFRLIGMDDNFIPADTN